MKEHKAGLSENRTLDIPVLINEGPQGRGRERG